MGEDDDLTLVLSNGDLCQSQDHGIPPLPPEEKLDTGKVSKCAVQMLFHAGKPLQNAKFQGIVESRGVFYACGGDGVSACSKWDLR